MAFRVQGTSPADQALVVAMRESARVEDTTFSGVVRQAFSDYLGETVELEITGEYEPRTAEQAREDEVVAATVGRVPCDHRWERGTSGVMRCDRCKEPKP